MSDRIVAIIRTAVPAAVGAAATWLAKHFGVHIDTTTVAAEVTAGATGVYYLLVSTLERRWPAFGVLLGVPKAPSYRSSATPPLETGDEHPAPFGLEQLKELLPPGTQVYVPPTPHVEPKRYQLTLDATGVHLLELPTSEALS